MSGNEWVDVFHLVVPVAYLDFVALDKRWIHFVRNHLPLSQPSIANVYGPGELESFITVRLLIERLRFQLEQRMVSSIFLPVTLEISE